MKPTKIILPICISLLILSGVLQNASASNRSFIPRVASSQPVSATAETWSPGYGISTDFFGDIENNFTWGFRLGFNRWKPNADDLLSVGGRSLEVERSNGWQTLSELSVIGSYRGFFLPAKMGSLWLEGGPGLYYLRWSKVEVLGNYAVDGAALNRTIVIPEGSDIVPGVSVGLSMVIIGRIEPIFRYQYIFTEDDPTQIMMLGIGLLSN